MLSGLMCRTAFRNASPTCPEIIVSPPIPTAAEIITGNSRGSPCSAYTSTIAASAAFAFNVSKIVSTSSTSLPPAINARI